MEHRYGRHGPRAWLRRRQRRYSRPSNLPVPVVPPTIVRVYVPTDAERIIFIIMTQGAQDPNEENPNRQVVEFYPGKQTPPTIQIDQTSDTEEMKRIGRNDTPLGRMRRYGERQARQDIAKIKNLYDLGENFTLRLDTIRKRNNILAQNLLWEKIYVEDSLPEEEEQENLIDAYQQKHEDDLNRFIKQYHFETIIDPHIASIRQIAIQDKIDFPNPPAMGFHQRDLGMIRVLHELEIPWDEAIDHLREIHKLADVYDKSYSNPKEGREWPNDWEPFPQLNF